VIDVSRTAVRWTETVARNPTMSLRQISIPWAAVRWFVVLAVIGGGAATYRLWWPTVQRWVKSTTSGFRPQAASGTGESAAESAAASHDESAPDHVAHDDAPPAVEVQFITLSPQAMLNLGLTAEFLQPIKLSTYPKSIRVPAILVERPGRTHIDVSTPLTAIITGMHAVSDQVVEPGELLFSLRLTHEEVVNAQTEFLTLLAEIDVEQKELERLRNVAEGAIPAKLLLEREYAIERLQAQIDAQHEALVLHGISDEMVRKIEKDRKLLRTLELFAPSAGEAGSGNFRLSQTQPVSLQADELDADEKISAADEPAPVLILEELRVRQGQAVAAGESLCVLANYGQLYIEGQAFEQDMADILNARERDWKVTAEIEGRDGITKIEGLDIAFIANEIDEESRTLHFYVELQNNLLPQSEEQKELGFVTWKYRPGQRLTLSVQVDEFPHEIVLPVDAVARDGAESFVFLQDFDTFIRRPVHVKYRDQTSVVIANDGAVFPGDVVAQRSAYQLQMALKNKSGGAIDPHAGHSH
jgi:cobalt-zinc-cadmium efflux system membrane fusion protein